MDYQLVSAIGVDDGAGCVNAVTAVEGTIHEVTFFAYTMGRRFNYIPGQKRPFKIMEYTEPVSYHGSTPIFDDSRILTVGDAAVYRTDGDVLADTGDGRYTSDQARARIFSAIARVLDPENFEDDDIPDDTGRAKAYQIQSLGLGMNLQTFRTQYRALRKFLVGKWTFRLNNTVYYLIIDSVVAESQPNAAMIYLRTMPPVAFDFDRGSLLLNDIGTWSIDFLPYVRGVLDEDRAGAVFVGGVDYVRRRLHDLLTAQFPNREFRVGELEFLITSPSPTIRYQSQTIGVGDQVQRAKTQSWREALAQMAPKLRGQEYDYAFFVGGGANVYRPVIEKAYANTPHVIVPNSHMVVAWGLYLTALKAAPEVMTHVKKTVSR